MPKTPLFRLLALAVVALALQAPARAEVDAAALFRAVVGVDAEIAANARTAGTLGTRREGSGVVIDDSGLVLTIGYVILEATAVDLVLGDERRVAAEVVAYDHETGFGLVRALEPIDATPLPLGSSAALAVSDQVLVATRAGPGAAQGAYVVARREFAGYWEYLLENAIFTAPPHAGFGGAALIGADGRLLGVGSLFVGDAASSGQPLAGNMFIPIDVLKPVLAELLDGGRRAGPYRPWLGVYPRAIQDHVFVGRVAAEGPAEAAGIEVGDLILAVGDRPVASMADFYRAIWAHGDAGDAIDLTIVRGPELKRLAVQSIDRYQWLRVRQSF